jgi:hypothetical protein
MRRGNRNGWHVEEGKVIFLNLGADYCAEHEWGINDLRLRLAVDGARPKHTQEEVKYKKPHGIERRRIMNHDLIRFYENKGQALLLCDEPWITQRFDEHVQKDGFAKAWKEYRPRELGLLGEETLATAWDGGSFGVLAKGKDDVSKLRELHKEILANNVAIWVGGTSNPFDRGGLILAIVSNVPAEHLETMRAADEDAEKLKAASDATGIVERLEAAKKEFFACSPRWLEGTFKTVDGEKTSSHPVIYWLNPMEQHENNHGWFTVEDLDQWIKGEGPVPKTAQVKK